jgi:gluconolactonase
VATGIGGPDGIAFSPDEKKLYIADTVVQSSIGRDSNIRVYDVVGERLANEKVFVPTFGAGGRTDGVRTDMDGNVWITLGSGDPNEFGVRCYAPNGDLIGKIHCRRPAPICVRRQEAQSALHVRQHIDLRGLCETQGALLPVTARTCISRPVYATGQRCGL